MRSLSAVFFIALGVTLASPPSHAQNYRWCAVYGTGGAKNCGFNSLEQCRATILGPGGSCLENTEYVEPAAAKRKKKKAE